EILVCIKQVADDSVEIFMNEKTGKPALEGVEKVVNAFDTYALEMAVRLKEAKGDFLGWTHADMQTDPKDVIKAYEILEKENWNKNIYVKGNRKGRPFFDQFFTFGMSVFETIFMGKVLYDVNAQPNIFSKEFFSKWENPPKDFSLDLYALYMAKKNKLKIIRFDVLFPERIHGQSTWNTGLASKWKFIKRTMAFSLELKKRGVK
uniref:glycosyltransferase family 2 protein n=1 Tax=uncultured Leptotrichia sp. TaxID=159271 RepID=UPI00262A2AA7